MKKVPDLSFSGPAFFGLGRDVVFPDFAGVISDCVVGVEAVSGGLELSWVDGFDDYATNDVHDVDRYGLVSIPSTASLNDTPEEEAERERNGGVMSTALTPGWNGPSGSPMGSIRCRTFGSCQPLRRARIGNRSIGAAAGVCSGP
jgi:hypothetical protein